MDITDTKGFLAGLKAKLPPTPTPYFDDTQRFDDMFIGDTRVIPSADIEGFISNNSRIPIGTLDGEDIYGVRDRKTASGRVGLDFVSPNSMVDNVPTTFGVGASGQYFTQEDKFPEVLNKFGVPDSVKSGKGLTIDQLQAYLNTPISENVDLTVRGRINPYYVDPVDGQMLGKDKFIGANLRYKF